MTITKDEMNNIALDIMSGNNLMKRDLLAEGWTFGFSNTRTALGDCSYGPKHIRLSARFLNARDKNEQINTITHEMAHAIAYTDFGVTGHGPVWKKIHRQLGGNAARCSSVSNPDAVKTKYVIFFKNDKGELEVVQRIDRMSKRFSTATIKTLYINGRKEESLGRLRCVSTETFESMQEDYTTPAEKKTEKKVETPKKKTEKKVETPKKKTEKKVETPKKKSPRGEEARKVIADAIKTIIFPDTKTVSFEQRGAYKDWYVTIELSCGTTVDKRLDAFKKAYKDSL